MFLLCHLIRFLFCLTNLTFFPIPSFLSICESFHFLCFSLISFCVVLSHSLNFSHFNLCTSFKFLSFFLSYFPSIKYMRVLSSCPCYIYWINVVEYAYVFLNVYLTIKLMCPSAGFETASRYNGFPFNRGIHILNLTECTFSLLKTLETPDMSVIYIVIQDVAILHWRGNVVR